MKKFGFALPAALIAFGFTAMLLAQSAPKAIRLTGQLSKIDGQTLTITAAGSQTTAVTCNDTTGYWRDVANSAAPAKFADLRVGQQLRIYYTPGNNAVLVVHIAKANGPTTAPATAPAVERVAGQLTKIDGQALTITGADGKATVITCNAATRISRDGDTTHTQLKLSDLQAGQQVRAYYTVADNVARGIMLAKPPAGGSGN